MRLKAYLCFMLIHFFVINLVHAQHYSAAYSEKLDSLEHVLDIYKKEDDKKVKLMNDYSRLCFYNQRFHDGFVTAHAARELSEQLDFEEGIVMYYLTLASYHENGDMRTFYQKKAQWLSKVLDEQLDQYNKYMNIPGYRLGVDYEDQITEFNTTLKYFEELGDVEMQANLMVGLSYLNQQLGREKEALEHLEKAKVLFNAINEPYPVFLISLYKMNELINSGNNEEAKEIEYELIELISKHKNENIIGLIASSMATNYRNRGRWALAIEYYIKSLEVFDQFDDPYLYANSNFWLGISYENLNMNSKAVESYEKSIASLEQQKDSSNLLNAYGTVIFPLIALDRFEDAKKYLTLALLDTLDNSRTYVLARYNDAKGQIFLKQGKYELAIQHFNRAFDGFNQLEYNRWATPFMKLYLSECYLKIGDYNKALQEGILCLEMENAFNNHNTIIHKKISLLLSEIYEQIGNEPMAYKYLKMYQELRAESERLDEANRIADAEVRSILDKSQKEIDELEKAKLQKEQESRIQRLWIFSIAGAFLSALILSTVLYQNNRSKQKANVLLKEQKEEIESTLEKLESTQTQLIQSEKMASLGELTAGIAHEIQNPLNFVNNFSELNDELLDELKEAIANNDQEEIAAIYNDLKENESKIKHHGQRAEGIVKGMLQHSRTSYGEKEIIDLNALADEYLRLAYHGMRAKDKSFNAEFRTDFDPNLPKINGVPQDIGRVLLNLINNAFQAVADGEKPEVIVTSTKLDNSIKITVKDNGPGIPEDIKDKIFQPFFTTKPTGSGTGLGLSLSYDIVKAHRGEINVKSKEGEGTEFTITLPK